MHLPALHFLDFFVLGGSQLHKKKTRNFHRSPADPWGSPLRQDSELGASPEHKTRSPQSFFGYATLLLGLNGDGWIAGDTGDWFL